MILSFAHRPRALGALLALGLAGALLVATPARGDDDDDDHERREHGERDHDDDDDRHERRDPRDTSRAAARAPSGVAPVMLTLWSNECGSCHMAYAPGMLPVRSWNAILGDLSNHFGDDASVADPTRDALLAYATTNAADVSGFRLSRSLARASEGLTPLRVSTLPAIVSQHDEIPEAWFKEPDIRSRANCVACHTKAASGSFREGEIRIPGHAGWDD